MLAIVLLGGMLLFLLLLLGIKYFTRDKVKITRKIRHYAGDELTLVTERPQVDYLEKFMGFIRRLGHQVRNVPQSKFLENKMQQVGLPLLGSEFLALLLVLGLGCSLLCLMLTEDVLYAGLAGLAAVGLSLGYIDVQISRRQVAFNNQLGDALTMLANAMRAGFSFLQALDLIAKELGDPLAGEFFKLLAEIRLGTDMEAAMLHMEERVQSADLDLVVTAVLIHKQVGGNLAQILDTIGETINERIKMKREIRTLTAQGRLSGWVLAALPFVVAALLSVANPGYLKPLVEEPLGRLVIAVSLVSEIIGFVLIQKIAKLDI